MSTNTQFLRALAAVVLFIRNDILSIPPIRLMTQICQQKKKSIRSSLSQIECKGTKND